MQTTASKNPDSGNRGRSGGATFPLWFAVTESVRAATERRFEYKLLPPQEIDHLLAGEVLSACVGEHRVDARLLENRRRYGDVVGMPLNTPPRLRSRMGNTPCT